MEGLKQRTETHCKGHVGVRRRVKEKGGGRERELKRLKKRGTGERKMGSGRAREKPWKMEELRGKIKRVSWGNSKGEGRRLQSSLLY